MDNTRFSGVKLMKIGCYSFKAHNYFINGKDIN
jgi:hypothetical protein